MPRNDTKTNEVQEYEMNTDTSKTGSSTLMDLLNRRTRKGQQAPQKTTQRVDFCGFSLKALTTAYRKADLAKVLKAVDKGVAAGEYTWVPLGGDDNNLGRINQLSLPESGLSENLANAMDALIELEIRKGRAEGLRSPQEVVAACNLAGDDRLIQLSICADDSYYDADGAGERQCATIEIRDFGVGLTAGNMPKTILALGSNTKNNDPRYGGRFGQGGSTALTFLASDGASLYMTRHYESDVVALTLVQRYKSPQHRNPYYRYLIDTTTGLPPTLLVSKWGDDFKHGTLIRHFGYKLDKRDLTFYQQATSRKNCLHKTLFEVCINPLIPFRIYDKRPNARQRNRVTGENISGALNRVASAYNNQVKGQTEPKIVYISNTHKVPLEDNKGQVIGHVDLVYAVTGFLTDTDKRPLLWINNLVNQGSSGKVHLSGMAVDDIPRDMVRKDLRMPHLDNYLLIYVNLDGLGDDALTSVLKPDRESMAPGFKDILMDEIFAIMQDDDQLHYWNNERKKRENSSQALDDTIKRIKDSFKNLIAGNNPGQTQHRGEIREVTWRTRRNEPFDPIPLADPPTFLEIVSASPKAIYPGKTFGFTFKSDAGRYYLKNMVQVRVDDALVDSSGVSFADPKTGTAQGYNMVTGLKARPDVPVGTEVFVTLSLMNEAGNRVISEDTIRCVVTEHEKRRQKDNTGIKSIDVKWISQGDAVSRGMENLDRALVTLALDGEDNLTVCLVEGATIYDRNLDLIASYGKKGVLYDQYADKLRSEYEYRVAVAAIRYYLDTAEMPEFSGVGEEDNMPPTKFELAMMRAAETACEFYAEYYRSIS